MIFLMGGEPLLYKGFGDMLRYVKSKGMICQVTTNGLLLPQFVDDLKCADLVQISLDGAQVGNDLNRGKGTFEKIFHAVEVAKKSEIPIRLNSVLTRNNINDVEWLLDLGDKLNAFVGFTIPANCPELEAMRDEVLTRDEIIDAHKKLLDYAKQGRKITLSVQSIEHVLKYPRDFDKLVYKTDPDHRQVSPWECTYGRFLIFIDATGSVYPCTTLWEYPSVFTPKNIFHHGWDEALRNAQSLPCYICYCAGGAEWNVTTSLAGIWHSLRFMGTLRKG